MNVMGNDGLAGGDQRAYFVEGKALVLSHFGHLLRDYTPACSFKLGHLVTSELFTRLVIRRIDSPDFRRDLFSASWDYTSFSRRIKGLIYTRRASAVTDHATD